MVRSDAAPVAFAGVNPIPRVEDIGAAKGNGWTGMVGAEFRCLRAAMNA